MIEKFINGSFFKLIEKYNYMPVTDENGVISKDSNIKILSRFSSGSYMVVEVINADILSNEEIKERLKINRQILKESQLGSTFFFFFEVFVFRTDPDKDKLQTIISGQYMKAMSRKYLRCISVNLADRKVEKLFKLPFTAIGIDKLLKSVVESNFDSYAEHIDVNELIEKKEKENTLEFSAKVPWITYVLMAINIGVWAILALYGLMKGVDYNSLIIDFGAKDNLRIILGEYWRFITPIFLHANLTHMAINTYSLFAVGRTVEKLFGHLKYIFIYIIAGILGNIMSFMFSTHPGVGASGSIFGLLGALLYFGIENPVLFKRCFGNDVIVTIAINITYGFSNTGIDNFAHIGGLIGGFLSAGIVKIKNVSNKFLSRPVFLIAVIFITVAGVLYGFNNKQNTILVYANQLNELNKSKNWVESEQLGEKIINMKPSDSRTLYQVLWNLSIAEASLGNYDEAIDHAKEIIKIDPAYGHYMLGILYYDSKKYEQAKSELLEAKKIGLKDNANNVDKLISNLEKIIGSKK